jgi:hypothetical protein
MSRITPGQFRHHQGFGSQGIPLNARLDLPPKIASILIRAIREAIRYSSNQSLITLLFTPTQPLQELLSALFN